MTIESITSDRLAPPVGPFSQAVRFGDLIFFSGQVGQDPATGKPLGASVEIELLVAG